MARGRFPAACQDRTADRALAARRDLDHAAAWVIATSRQGEGLATEAAAAAMAWLRDRCVTRFVAHVHRDHGASAAVARHLGLAATEVRHQGEVRWSVS